VINKYAEREREFVLERTRLFLALRAELQTKEPDEKAITEKVLELEKMQSEHLQLKQQEIEELATLLTPLERAKLLVAEDSFRQNLRRALRSHGRKMQSKRP